MNNNVNLTNREYQICFLLCKGLDNFSIAQKLGISKFTVKEYLKTLFKKFNVANRAQLAYVLGKENIIEL